MAKNITTVINKAISNIKGYYESVYKVSVWIIMSDIEAFAELRIRSVLTYSTDSKFKNNEEIGHYEQTLFSFQRSCMNAALTRAFACAYPPT